MKLEVDVGLGGGELDSALRREAERSDDIAEDLDGDNSFLACTRRWHYFFSFFLFEMFIYGDTTNTGGVV